MHAGSLFMADTPAPKILKTSHMYQIHSFYTVSTENAPLQDFVHMENLKFSVQYIGPNLPFEFVLRDIGKSEF